MTARTEIGVKIRSRSHGVVVGAFTEILFLNVGQKQKQQRANERKQKAVASDSNLEIRQIEAARARFKEKALFTLKRIEINF